MPKYWVSPVGTDLSPGSHPARDLERAERIGEFWRY
jgi:hypothetical protein